MPSCRAIFVITLVCLFGSATAAYSDNWSQFRGPSGNATSSNSSVPTQWSETENIAWKTRLPGRGASSPVIWEDRVFVTAFTGYGMSDDEPGDKSDLRLHVICIDRHTGKLLWDKSIAGSENTQSFSRRIADHGYATSTPATDGKAVYAFFGVSGVVAYDFDGKLLWQANVGTKTAGFGSASSPVVFENLLIVNASIESGTVFAFDKQTGKEAWRIGDVNKAWTSPCIAEAPGGEPEMVINQKETIYGFDPRTGEKLWSCDGIQDYVVPVPVSHNGVVYCLGGRSNRCIAVRLGGRGDVTETHKLWEVNTGANVTSPVYCDGHVYWASDKAVANCLKAENGEKVYQQRLPTRARIYASIVRAGDRLYVTTRDQGVVVLAAEPEYKELARNVLADDEGLVNASPAISNNQLLIRTDSYLYCIGQKAAE
jgi:outer membrane protein assembly factor BamB